MKKTDDQLIGTTTQILGVRVNSTNGEKVLRFLEGKIEEKEKVWVVTPNPEFIVAAQKDPSFKKNLNEADLALCDGQGLVWASRFLKTAPVLSQRVAGADIAEELLKMSNQRGWRVGIVGARRGVREEREQLIKKLKERFGGIMIESLEEISNWKSQSFEIIFVCQGMKKQEAWIAENKTRVKALIFMGIGGSLDFLTGFSQRAPLKMRQLGLEWLWRLGQNPSHIRRIWTACVVFPWMVLKKKLRG